MPYRNGNIPRNTIEWTDKMKEFLIDNFYSLTNKQLAAGLGLRLTAVRTKCYELGLKRMELEYWTSEQVDFLKDNYTIIGDKELTEIFQNNWPKNKKWTHKHIEKKRKYLKLKRTREQILAIHQRNVDNGRFLMCPVKRWKITGMAKEGDIRMWREHSGRFAPRIKINGRFIHWNRWAWQQEHGPIPKRMCVVFKDNDPANQSIDNLELITINELSRRNSQTSSHGLSDNYVAAMISYGDPELREEIKKNPQIIELKRQQLLLNRAIYEQQNISQTA